MLQITIPPVEGWDERTETFVNLKGATLQLEHSLVSLSKWESKWRKPFISKENKSHEETIDYIKCMTITQNVKPDVYARLTNQHLQEINDYIGAEMTATTFSEEKNGKRNNEKITAEIIYHWMIALQLPMECQKWHLNRLIALIRVCSIKNAPPKKMSKRDIMSQNAALNEARKKALNTRG